ncbi:MAG: DUF3823 domain-containing protein [Alistipes sp.]
MKKISFYTLLCALLSFSSCDLYEIDNYDAPAETIRGKVVDVATGEPVLTDQASEGIRVRLLETSWGPNATPNPDFYCMPNGEFQNTKIFKGYYNVRVDGPFIPLVRETAAGVPISDESQNLTIKGTTEVEFKVQPFLKVEWMSDPMVSNGRITAQVRVTRAVSEKIFREKIEPMGNWKDNYLNMTDIQFFVSYSSSVGYRARDERWSSKIEYAGDSFKDLFGTTVTIKSLGSVPPGRKVFVRAAARINYATEGQRRWNYSEPMEVIIP